MPDVTKCTRRTLEPLSRASPADGAAPAYRGTRPSATAEAPNASHPTPAARSPGTGRQRKGDVNRPQARPKVRRATLAAACAAAALAVSAVPSGGAAALDTKRPPWAAVGDATLGPGVVLATGSSDCTSNFVFTDADDHVYLGQAAHCSSKDDPANFDGCKDKSLPLGSPVTVLGSNVTGKLAYNSWLTMQRRQEKNPAACLNNDFALVRLPDQVRDVVNPTVPYFGGPVGLNTAGTQQGERAYSYGNSPLRGGIGMLAPKQGTVLAQIEDGWSHLTYFVTPGVPGDSGSAVLDKDGRALGVLSSLSIAPAPGSNGVADLQRMLAYAQDFSGIPGLRLAKGTERFRTG